jgi:hypothetical protein
MLSERDRRALAHEVVRAWGQSEERASTVAETALAVGELFMSAREGLTRELLSELDARGLTLTSSLVADVERARRDVSEIDEQLRRQGCPTAIRLRPLLWRVDDVLRRVCEAALRSSRGSDPVD